MGNFFIQNLAGGPAERFYFFAVVITVVISIVLHELAHGWMAMRLGDPTPRTQGRMTGNPLVHTGPWSLLALALVGIAWGQMPIDPGRLRGKYAEAKVALAGPAVNLMLGAIGVVGYTVCVQLGVDMTTPGWQGNAVQFLQVFGLTNFLLMFFNLVPVPPLDGSHIVANFSSGYARLLSDPTKQGIWMLAFVGVFVLGSVLLMRLSVGLFVGVSLAVSLVMGVLGF